MKGGQISQHYLKNYQKLNLKKQVFQLIVRTNIKTQNEQKLLRKLEGLPPIQYLALYA